MIVFDTATIVADSDRYLPTVQSALRIVALSHPEAAERVVALPLRTVETMHAVLKGETRDENASGTTRSEERRVGKEGVSTCRSRWSPDHYKKKKRKENTTQK